MGNLETGPVSALHVAQAKASYQRCFQAPDFFQAFYRTFFEACPEAEARFANTDFERQHKLLQHAMGLLLLFPTKPPAEAKALLRRVALRHSREDLAIDPSFYAPFVDSMIATAKDYDREFTPEIETAWRSTMAPGVAYMISKF